MTLSRSPSLSRRITLLAAVAASAVFCMSMPVHASALTEAAVPPGPSTPFGAAVSERLLDRIRGGFALPDAGTALTVDVRQSVYVNDAMAGTSTLRLTQNGSRISVEQSSPVLVQLGAGNGFTPGALAAGAATAIVQNSLDNQNIRTVTQVDVSATMLRAYRDLALQSTLNGALVRAVRH